MRACLPDHLETLQKSSSGKPNDVFYLVVQGYGFFEDYWLHLAVTAQTTLHELDRFLRETWLECCGHLSMFEIDGIRFDSYPFELSDADMNHHLGDVLEADTTFQYEYDFGTTSELDLRVADVFALAAPKQKIQVLGRNESPELTCQQCGKAQATQICAICLYEGNGLFCERCTEKHNCGEEMWLPVVNSPRTGMCGYEGPAVAEG
ncbi:MAG TPA: hypothetical protein VKP65_15845 [Rhodothermales bacterium]|nr:hypothetical protein [Rhodothermales bacterium]